MKNKKYFILLSLTFIFCFKTTNSIAQTINDVFDSDVKLNYLGIDFSNAKCYGEGTRFDAADITLKINNVARNEYDKYNLSYALNKNSVNVQFDLTQNLNSKIDNDKFFTYNESDLNKLDESAIQKIVSRYNFDGYEQGLAVVFIVDNLNKSKGQEVAWITFINISTQKVIFTEKMKASPGGFGIRNYWVRPFYDMIKEVKHPAFKKWKKKYAAK